MASGDVFPKMLASPTQAGTSSTTLFTVASGHQYTVKQIIICNTDTIDRLVSVGYNGASTTAANCIVYNLPVAASDTVVVDTALVLEASATLTCSSDTASKVNVSVTGWDRTI